MTETLTILKSALFKMHNGFIQSNGKELFTNKTSGNMQSLPLTNEEKGDIQSKLTNNFGLALNRSRSVVTNADISWKSLHINLSDLGLDDSIIKDAQMITNAFNIPRELISYDGKGAKYENQIQASIGFIQGVIQDNIDDICNSISSNYKMDGKELIGSFEHLPIMQTVEVKKTEATKKKAEALQLLLNAGFSSEDALAVAGFNKVKLTSIKNEKK